jgi:plasmid maintenance system antidote protein VapI
MARNPISKPVPKTPLDEFMTDHGVTDARLSEAIGCTREYVSMLRKGARKVPSLDLALKIERFTNGQVPASSWSDAA